MSERSLYDILNVSKNATKQEMTKQYKALMKKHHPDKAIDDKDMAERAKISEEITEAYLILSDDEKRNIYDQTGTKENIDDIKRHGGMPFGMSGGLPPEFAAMMGMGGMGGMNRKHNTVQFQPDIIINIRSSLEDIYKGIKITKEIVRKILTLADGKVVETTEKETINIEFLLGSENEKKITIPGKGNKLYRHGQIQVGSIIIVLREEPHDIYKRSTRRPYDLYMNQQINLYQSLLGEFKLNIIEINGNKTSIIVDATPIRPNKAIKIPNKGMISPKGTRGDLYIIFDIHYPVAFIEKHRIALKKMANYVSENNGTKYEQIDINDLNELLNMQDENTETTYNHTKCVNQ